MIKQELAETALEIGLQAKRQGLFVDRGIERRQEYRITSAQDTEQLQIYLGFVLGKELFTEEALKIVVVEGTDASHDTYSLRVMTDLDPQSYENPFDELVLRDLAKSPQPGQSLVVVARAVTPTLVDRILHPENYLHGPMIFEEDRYFAA